MTGDFCQQKHTFENFRLLPTVKPRVYFRVLSLKNKTKRRFLAVPGTS